MRRLSLFSLLAVLSIPAFGGKPAPAPSYQWYLVLLNDGNIKGDSGVIPAPVLDGLPVCQSSYPDPVCSELSNRMGWVYLPDQAVVSQIIQDPGYMVNPAIKREARFSILFSNSVATHGHLSFGSISGTSSPRIPKTTTSRGMTTTWQNATSCFLDFGTSNLDYAGCVLNGFLSNGNHPLPGYAEVRLAFNASADVAEKETGLYYPATFWFEDDYAPNDYGAPCNLDKANLIGTDYPADPASASALPDKGTYIQRRSKDAWMVRVSADFAGGNPFSASPDSPDNQDVLKAVCYETPAKSFLTYNENRGKPSFAGTLYLIRKQVQ